MNCDKCFDGNLIEKTNKGFVYRGLCQCQAVRFNQTVWDFVFNKVHNRVRKDLPALLGTNLSIKENQAKVAEIIKTENRFIICGPSTFGKSFLTLARFYKLCSTNEFMTARFYTGSGLAKMFSEKHEDYSRKLEYEDMIAMRANKTKVCIIDDLDKILPASTAQTKGIYDIFDEVLDNIPYVFINMNLKLEQFCKEAMTDGRHSPLYSRIKESFRVVEI